MASSSSRSNYHVRSVSLPCQSHPTVLSIEEHLTKLRTTWGSDSPSTLPSVDKICSSLTSQLEELYRSVDDLLSLPVTQQTLSHHQNEKWVDELLDGSVRLVDICGCTRDVMSQIKEDARDLLSALRRRRGDTNVVERCISNYASSSKKTGKDTKRLIVDLKQIDNKMTVLELDDHHLSSVIRVLREVISFTASILRSLLMFLLVPVLKPRSSSKWSLVSKLIQQGTSENSNENELESRLEALDASVNEFDAGFESLFRRLIATRASLLNIVSY